MENICNKNKKDKDNKFKMIYKHRKHRWYIYIHKWVYNQPYQVKSYKLYQKINKDS